MEMHFVNYLLLSYVPVCLCVCVSLLLQLHAVPPRLARTCMYLFIYASSSPLSDLLAPIATHVSDPPHMLFPCPAYGTILWTCTYK